MENNEVVDGALNVSDVVEEKKETKKPAAKKTTAKKATEKKTTGKKATSKKESTAKNTNIKEAIVTKQMFIEFDGKQIDEDLIVQKVEEECKKQEVTVKELTLYFKPEDNACYYVVNNNVSGKVELF